MIGDQIKLDISQDLAAEQVIFQVEMPVNAYLELAFGSDLDQYDMVMFSSNEEETKIEDCYYD